MKNSEQKRSAQASNSLAERIRWVIKRHAGTQSNLAEAMGVGLDRVKTLSLGRAKNLRPSEVQALRARYGLAEEWLHAGRGPEHVHEVLSGASSVEVLAFDRELFGRAVEAVTVLLAQAGASMPEELRVLLHQAAYAVSIKGRAVEIDHIRLLVDIAVRAWAGASKAP